MASFNFRPENVKEIEGKKFKNSKALINLFLTLRSDFPDIDEPLVISLENPKLVKVVRALEQKAKNKLPSYRKLFKGDIESITFGNGSPQKGDKGPKPTTAQQERCTLIIFESLLSRNKKTDTKNFEDLVPALEKEFPDITLSSDWYNSFRVQYEQLNNYKDLANGKYDVFDRDSADGFMSKITSFIQKNKHFNINKKDSWNPADIWLLSDKWESIFELISKCNNIQLVNEILREKFKSKDIVGISLKKNNGKKLQYEEVNLEHTGTSTKILGKGQYVVDLTYNYDKNKFKLVSSKIEFTYHNKKYICAVRRNQETISNIVYEFSGTNESAQLGKVPFDMMRLYLIDAIGKKVFLPSWKKLPQTLESFKRKSKSWELLIKTVLSSSSVTIKGENDSKKIIELIERSYSANGGKLNLDLSAIMQIIHFASLIARIPKKNLDLFYTETFYASQKKGNKFGPFGKLY